MTERSAGDSPIDRALAALHDAIRAEIRAEQLRDRLTGLASLEALDAWLESKTSEGAAFWVAFLEVDKFKSINDEFGYEHANSYLLRVGEELRHAAGSFFGPGTVPFRAHGDEFYLAGRSNGLQDEDIAGALELTAANIAASKLSVRLGQTAKVMHGTVSTGWLQSVDAREAEAGLTVQAVKQYLEIAVERAKQNRGSIVRWEASFERLDTAHGRADCSSCETKFELRLKLARRAVTPLYCPHCGERVDRPPALLPPADN